MKKQGKSEIKVSQVGSLTAKSCRLLQLRRLRRLSAPRSAPVVHPGGSVNGQPRLL
jgi:hypothetical protein